MQEVSFEKYAPQVIQTLPKGAFLTVSHAGRDNTMTIGWGNIGVIWNKPIFTVLVRPSRFTFGLLEASGEFTVSVPLTDMSKALALCGSKSGRDMDKFAAAALQKLPGTKITRKMVRAMAKNSGPMYIRINRNDLPVLTPEEGEYQIGKLYTVREGSDVVVFANGVMVSKALAAAEELAKSGVSVKVVNVSTVKPLDRQGVIEAVKGVKAVVTAEEHNVIGGLGSAIAEALRLETGVPLDFVGIEDKYGTSALNYDELLEYYGLTAAAIVTRIKGLV